MPAPSGPRSGKHGAVNGINTVRNWSLNITGAIETRYHSASRGGPERYAGVEDWNGVIEGFGGNPGIFPGDSVALVLFSGPDDGVYGHDGLTYYGTALIDSLAINWNWQPSQSLTWSAGFSANGCIASQDDTIADTPNIGCTARMCSLSVAYLDDCGTTGTSFTEWDNIESATLTFNADNQMYVNSSTNCCTGRRPGNIDWTLELVDQEDYAVMDSADVWAFRLYDTATTYWQLYWGILQDLSNIRVDIESGAIKTKTNTIVMNGRTCCANVGTGTTADIGYIINPSGGTEWPIPAA